MDKAALIAAIIAQLGAELENYARSARAAHAEATDEQSKAENKYDTRGLEASYLARGQSLQALEVTQAIQAFKELPVREFAGAAADLGALVELEDVRERTLYFLAPRAGGTEVTLDGRTVLVITPHSPLGQQLAGAKAGTRVKLKIGRTTDTYRVVGVE